MEKFYFVCAVKKQYQLISILQLHNIYLHLSTSKIELKKKILYPEPSTSSNNLSSFNTDLCRMNIRADFLIFKLKN